MDAYDWIERVLRDPSAIPEAAEHPDWRVRYGAAVACGRALAPDPAHGPSRETDPVGAEARVRTLFRILDREEGRPLYDQPRARYPGSHDDTRMAEQIRAVRVEFDREATEEEMEAWKCRGRVRQAALFALGDLGPAASGDLLAEAQRRILGFLDETDAAVRMAAARALGRLGDPDSLRVLERLQDDPEWCTRTEARKALVRIRSASRPASRPANADGEGGP